MVRIKEFFKKHDIATGDYIDREKFSVYIACAMDKLAEYMALCCYFDVPCVQRMKFQERFKIEVDKFQFEEEDFGMSQFDDLLKNGLSKLEAYTERMTFNAKAIALRVRPICFLELFSGNKKLADEFYRIIYFVDNALERVRAEYVEDGWAEIKDDVVVAREESHFHETTKRTLAQNYGLTEQLERFYNACAIANYDEKALAETEDSWGVPDEERTNGMLTEAEFILCSALFRMGIETPNHIG